MRNTKIQPYKKQFIKQMPLQVFVLAGIIYLIIFSFIPMVGIVMAFKD